jgi:hypothetical protein
MTLISCPALTEKATALRAGISPILAFDGAVIFSFQHCYSFCDQSVRVFWSGYEKLALTVRLLFFSLSNTPGWSNNWSSFVRDEPALLL